MLLSYEYNTDTLKNSSPLVILKYHQSSVNTYTH